MRKLLFVVAVLLLCAGQMCTGVEAKPDRLEPNDSLRSACGDMPDAVMRTILIGTDSDRQAGISKQAELKTFQEGCSQWDDRDKYWACLNCYTAIVHQVYSD